MLEQLDERRSGSSRGQQRPRRFRDGKAAGLRDSPGGHCGELVAAKSVPIAIEVTMLRICLMLAAITLIGGSSREGPPAKPKMVLRQGWPQAPSGIPQPPSAETAAMSHSCRRRACCPPIPTFWMTSTSWTVNHERLTLATVPLRCRVRRHRVEPAAERRWPVSRLQFARDRSDRPPRQERSGRRLRARRRDRHHQPRERRPRRAGREWRRCVSGDQRRRPRVVFESTATNLVPATMRTAPART